MDHENAEDLKEKGNQKLGAKQYDDAIDLYTQAIRLNGQNAVYYNNRATAYLGAGLAKKALADCDQSLRIDPKYAKALFRRGCINISLGRLREAKQDFQSFSNCEPSNIQHVEKLQVITKIEQHLHNAEEYCKRGDFEQASQFYNAALALAPHANSCKIGLAKTLIGRKMYNEAAKQASSVLQNDPEDIDALLTRAKAFYGLGEDWKTLGPYLRNILQLDPDNTEALQLRKKSQTIFNLKTQGNDKFNLLKQLRGQTLPDEEKNALKAQYSQEALQAYQEAMLIDPENPHANSILLFNIAVVKLELGQKLEAVTELDKALTLNPDYSKLYAIRASINSQLERYQEAVRDYHEASTRDPNSQDLKQKLKEAQKKLKESEKKDYYKILDLPRNCNDHEIKKKYRQLAMEYHPDRHASKSPEEQEAAAVKFKDINEAHSVLSDPKKRQRFDSGADDMEGMGGFDMSDIFSNVGRGGGGGHPFAGFGGASFGGFGGGGHPFGGFGGGGHPFGGSGDHYY